MPGMFVVVGLLLGLLATVQVTALAPTAYLRTICQYAEPSEGYAECQASTLCGCITVEEGVDFTLRDLCNTYEPPTLVYGTAYMEDCNLHVTATSGYEYNNDVTSGLCSNVITGNGFINVVASCDNTIPEDGINDEKIWFLAGLIVLAVIAWYWNTRNFRGYNELWDPTIPPEIEPRSRGRDMEAGLLANETKSSTQSASAETINAGAVATVVAPSFQYSGQQPANMSTYQKMWRYVGPVRLLVCLTGVVSYLAGTVDNASNIFQLIYWSSLGISCIQVPRVFHPRWWHVLLCYIGSLATDTYWVLAMGTYLNITVFGSHDAYVEGMDNVTAFMSSLSRFFMIAEWLQFITLLLYRTNTALAPIVKGGSYTKLRVIVSHFNKWTLHTQNLLVSAGLYELASILFDETLSNDNMDPTIGNLADDFIANAWKNSNGIVLVILPLLPAFYVNSKTAKVCQSVRKESLDRTSEMTQDEMRLLISEDHLYVRCFGVPLSTPLIISGLLAVSQYFANSIF